MYDCHSDNVKEIGIICQYVLQYYIRKIKNVKY